MIDTRSSRPILGILVFGHLLVISHQVDGGGGVSLLQRTVFAALAPLQSAVAATLRGTAGAWEGYVDLRGVREENERLRQRLRLLETQLQERSHLAAEAERLRDLLDLRKVLPLETVVAEVVARDGQPWFHSITVDKGTRDGVWLNAPVICPTGIVGRVIEVGPTAARVQLLLDQNSGVGVLVERSRATGVVSGQVGGESGSTELVMKYVSSVADVQERDVVVTSGLDRIFPKGLVVGRVRSVGVAGGLFKEVVVAPSARFDQLEEVLVLRVPAAPLVLTEAVK